jgi:hypothetical protein
MSRIDVCARPVKWYLEGLAVEIREQKVTSAWFYAQGELMGDTEDFEIIPDGSLRPQPAWADHSMPTIDDCTAQVLVTASSLNVT